jgi:hypothetical protein
MLKMIYGAAVAALFIATGTAHAVDLQDCSKGSARKRIACLEGNVKTLNSSYEKVAAELRKAVVDVNARIDNIKIPAPPDLSGFVRKTDSIKLGLDKNRCLSATSGESGEIPANPKPIDVRLLVTFQDCPGSPSWTFQ